VRGSCCIIGYRLVVAGMICLAGLPLAEPLVRSLTLGLVR
jgi:hypothetical protein